MEITEQIEKFHEFFEVVYGEQLRAAISKGIKSLVVSFSDLSKFNLELAQELIDNPEDVLRACEIAIEQFDFPGAKEFRIRFRGLPKSQEVLIRDIRSTHLSKFIQITGVVRQKTDVRPQVTSAKFECPSCGNTINVLQLDSKFREPTTCGCGRKGRFRLIGKEMIDAQKIVLEESADDIEGSEQPKRMDVFLKGDLVSPMSEKRTNPGSKEIVIGILKEVPILAKDGGKLTRFDLMVEANYIESVAEEFTELNITEEEIREIKELSEDPKVYKKIVSSIAPSIYGHDKVKEALVLQIFGGVRKKKDDGSINRGDIHILLIGDPGSGKVKC
jgi:replicative DNA helicase Mcm